MTKFNSYLSEKFTQDQLNREIEQVETKIKPIFELTKGSLKIIKSETNKITTKLTTSIQNLEINHNSLNNFNSYTQRENLMKKGAPVDSTKLPHLGQIYLHLDNYKRTLKSNNTRLKKNLNELKTKLTVIEKTSKQVCDELTKYTETGDIMTEINEMNRLLARCLILKQDYIDKLDQYLSYFYTLKRIDSSISYLKARSSLNQEYVDKDYISNVNSLQRLAIIPNTIDSFILTIKKQINYIISELQLAKLFLEYRASIKIMLLRLNSCYIKNNVSEFLNHSESIIETLSQIPNAIEQIKSKIDSIKSQNPHLSKYEINEVLPKIREVIKNALIYIKIIRAILYNLLIVSYSSMFEEIKKKINQITGLDNALDNLPQIYSYIGWLYYFQLETRFILNTYSLKLDNQSDVTEPMNKLNEIIKETNNFMYIVSVYYSILYHTNVIVENMKNVKPKLDELTQFNEKFNTITRLVSIITNQLTDLNWNITQLKCHMSDLSLTNLKDKIFKYKNQIPVIKDEILTVNKIFEHTQKYIDNTVKNLQNKCEYIIKEIQKSIIYLSIMILVKEIMSIPNYAMNLNYKNPISKALSSLSNYLNDINSHIESKIKEANAIISSVSLNISILQTLVKTVKFILKKVEQSVNDLECAIEAVVRNMIGCSLKSLSNHLNNSNNSHLLINYSMIGVVKYSVVVNKLFESATKLDKIFELIPSRDGCNCILSLESKNRIALTDTSVYKMLDKLTYKPDEFNKEFKLDDIKKINASGSDANHFCLCIINKYVLYPQLIKLMYAFEIELDALSTASRKFDKYIFSKDFYPDTSHFYILFLELLYKVSIYILLTYKYSWTGWMRGVEIKCFCTYYQDSNYSMIVSIILFLSTIMENISRMDEVNLKMYIETLSGLISEFDIIGPNTTNSIIKNNCKLVIYQIMINKNFCRTCDTHSDPKCCCISCLIIILAVYLCISFKLKTKFNPGKCEQIKDRISEFLKLVCKYKGSVCCINTISEDCKQICSGNNNFQNLLDKCLKQCCEGTCPCKNTRESCKNLCEFLKTEVEKLIQCIDKCCKNDNCKCKIIYVFIVMKKIMELIEYKMKYELKFNSLTLSSVTRIALSNNIKILYLCYNKVMISMTKNSYITHFNTYTDHKNIANSFPSLTMGYAYDTGYQRWEGYQ